MEIPSTLSLSEYCVDRMTAAQYSLCATVDHIGDVRSGHYTANVKRQSTWVHMNDSVSKVVDFSDVESRKACVYTLLYERCHDHVSVPVRGNNKENSKPPPSFGAAQLQRPSVPPSQRPPQQPAVQFGYPPLAGFEEEDDADAKGTLEASLTPHQKLQSTPMIEPSNSKDSKVDRAPQNTTAQKKDANGSDDKKEGIQDEVELPVDVVPARRRPRTAPPAQPRSPVRRRSRRQLGEDPELAGL